jgi:hypothetical protein
LTTKTQARAQARALVGAAAFGSLAGLVIGCAYLGGEAARSNMIRADAERFAGAATSGYSERSLVAAAGGLDRDALAIARRHDPYVVAGGAERDHQAAQFAARFASASVAGLRPGLQPTRAAAPFRMEGGLDASRDLQCLTEAVYWEARGEGTNGMAAVAQVVLNRVRHPAFPKTVCGVVYQGASASDGGCQFSFACRAHPAPAGGDSVWEHAREIASRALSGHVMAEVGQATNFHATNVAPGWMTSLQRVAQIGSHIFYRFGHSSQPKDFRYAAEPTGQKASEPMLASLAPSFGAPASKPSGPVPYTMLQKALIPQPQGQPQQPQPQAAPAEAPRPASAGAKVLDAEPKP